MYVNVFEFVLKLIRINLFLNLNNTTLHTNCDGFYLAKFGFGAVIFFVQQLSSANTTVGLIQACLLLSLNSFQLLILYFV